LALLAAPYLIVAPIAVAIAIPGAGLPAPGLLELWPVFLFASVLLYAIYPVFYFLVCTWRLIVLSEIVALAFGFALGFPFGIPIRTFAEIHYKIAGLGAESYWDSVFPGFLGNPLIVALIHDAAILTGMAGAFVFGWPFVRAIRRFRRLRAGLKRHGIVLAFRPWRQPGFRAQMRAVSRSRVAAALTLFFLGVVAVQGVSTGIMGGFGTDPASRSLSIGIAAIVTLAALRAGHHVMRDANRRAMQGLGQLMQGDERRPVLFLRSFNDDHLQLRARRKPMLWPLVRRRLGAEGSFEEALTIALANFGPVVAIGRPGEAHLPVGAAREYVSDETWKERVDELIGQAQLIVILIGDTPGLAWEATRLLAPDVRGRVLFVMPPVTDAEAARRWAIMREQIARTGGDPALLPAALDKALVCTLAGDAGGRVFTAIDRAQDHYELAFALAGHEAATGPLPKEATRLVTGPRAA
jgi:hypothetical protein